MAIRPYKINITIHYSLFTIHSSLHPTPYTTAASLFPTPYTLHPTRRRLPPPLRTPANSQPRCCNQIALKSVSLRSISEEIKDGTFTRTDAKITRSRGDCHWGFTGNWSGDRDRLSRRRG
ncbi:MULTISPECIES: hypothetical protein [Planktothricoides]|uniref:Uncharacterized protein n=1 Tax=Planktothricoides raciborskii FACHB-1370 TaxID=2949576 RepID=A0ABR8EIR0_9CYAN|nr:MULTISPECIES: hypothetical protein [Planktothricoides]MBD2546395.1 hypothetical protein [Planktothricoides raciborskii FACHB-1370]MBD2584793.1 hypothetical protein [Planktothricoides raciborskii FACHB-1261]